jgi:hypothetical protein
VRGRFCWPPEAEGEGRPDASGLNLRFMLNARHLKGVTPHYHVCRFIKC